MFAKNSKRNYYACFDGITTLLVCNVAILVFNGGKPIVKNLKGFWDTGASNSAISKKVVEELGLPIYKANNTTTSITGSNCLNSYKINVFLNNEMWFENIEAFGIESKDEYEFVIGMDIIQQGNLILKNNRKTTIQFKRIVER